MYAAPTRKISMCHHIYATKNTKASNIKKYKGFLELFIKSRISIMGNMQYILLTHTHIFINAAVNICKKKNVINTHLICYINISIKRPHPHSLALHQSFH